MITANTLPSLVAGVVVGFCLVIACGDDGGAPIDAAAAADAACDCPAAEPPIADRFVVRASPVVIDAGATMSLYAGCNVGELLVGGGCRTVELEPAIALTSSGRDDGDHWQCTWTSTAPVAADAVVQAFCLVPP